MQDIRIALAVVNCPLAAIEENLVRLARWSRAAASEGAAIVCFPELNLTGYDIGAEISAAAQTVPGPTTERLEAVARDTSLTILAGVAEKDCRGRVFATHLVVTPDGIAGVYRKIHIAPPEKTLLTAGDDIPVFTIQGITFGIQLCFDGHFPELSTQMALKGCDVIFMPHASPRGNPPEKLASWMRHLPARAFDNGIFIAACNQVGANKQGLKFPGIAAVFGPTGTLLRHVEADKEALLVVDLTTEQLNGVRRHRMRYFLPHRRSDLY